MADTVKVYPHPSLAERREYLPGIGIDGAEIPANEANDLHDRGLVLFNKSPKAETFHNAGADETAAQDQGAEASPPAEAPSASAEESK